MPRVRAKRRVPLGVVSFGVVSFGVVLACGGPEEPGDVGDECYRDGDCKVGLVCVPSPGGARTCSSDVTDLVSTVETPPPPPPDAGTMDDAAPPEDPDGG